MESNSSNKSSECPKCNKTFANKYSLKTHMASTVSCKEAGAKPTPLECTHCKRSFVHKARYETHIKSCPREKSDANNSQLVVVEPEQRLEVQKQPSESFENKKLVRKIAELEKSLEKE